MLTLLNLLTSDTNHGKGALHVCLDSIPSFWSEQELTSPHDGEVSEKRGERFSSQIAEAEDTPPPPSYGAHDTLERCKCADQLERC